VFANWFRFCISKTDDNSISGEDGGYVNHFSMGAFDGVGEVGHRLGHARMVAFVQALQAECDLRSRTMILPDPLEDNLARTVVFNAVSNLQDPNLYPQFLPQQPQDPPLQATASVVFLAGRSADGLRLLMHTFNVGDARHFIVRQREGQPLEVASHFCSLLRTNDSCRFPFHHHLFAVQSSLNFEAGARPRPRAYEDSKRSADWPSCPVQR
jgi:hypothetical protein